MDIGIGIFVRMCVIYLFFFFKNFINCLLFTKNFYFHTTFKYKITINITGYENATNPLSIN